MAYKRRTALVGERTERHRCNAAPQHIRSRGAALQRCLSGCRCSPHVSLCGFSAPEKISRQASQDCTALAREGAGPGRWDRLTASAPARPGAGQRVRANPDQGWVPHLSTGGSAACRLPHLDAGARLPAGANHVHPVLLALSWRDRVQGGVGGGRRGGRGLSRCIRGAHPC